MASLTHVCMWREKGWVKITAEEAARLHPGGTVSAHSGLFMCELCGQYVLLTDSAVQRRHFRHSSSEKSKNCPERTFGAGVSYGYSQGDHELPIRITKITNKDFSLEMGFIQAPQNLLTPQLKICIKPNGYAARSFTYVKERLKVEGITYLSIGNVPSEHYSIEITGASESICQFWPKTIQGIDSTGTVFDASTGKKLVYDADVAVGKKYYLLRRGTLYGRMGSHVTYTEISRQSISWATWYVYEVIANDYDEVSARFFLDYHCRLTEQPISIQPVWPVYVENPYVIKHNQKSIVMHLIGNAPTTQVFPYAPVRSYPCANGSVIEIHCNNRQQLISAGRTKALQYTYFWKEPLSQITEKPAATVTDVHNAIIEGGNNRILPERRILSVTIPYDGVLTIKQDGFLVEKRKLHANTSMEVDGISWNTELMICVGLDVVWRALFCKEKALKNAEDEAAILHKFESYMGAQILIPHTMGCLASKLSDYPQIRQWLYKCIRSGHMSERAYRELQRFIKSIESNDENK